MNQEMFFERYPLVWAVSATMAHTLTQQDIPKLMVLYIDL